MRNFFWNWNCKFIEGISAIPFSKHCRRSERSAIRSCGANFKAMTPSFQLLLQRAQESRKYGFFGANDSRSVELSRDRLHLHSSGCLIRNLQGFYLRWYGDVWNMRIDCVSCSAINTALEMNASTCFFNAGYELFQSPHNFGPSALYCQKKSTAGNTIITDLTY